MPSPMVVATVSLQNANGSSGSTTNSISYSQCIRYGFIQWAREGTDETKLLESSHRDWFHHFSLLREPSDGEYSRTLMHRDRGLVFALKDIFTEANFAIAVVAAMIGYLIFEFLRKKL
jgi:hypothetical protein